MAVRQLSVLILIVALTIGRGHSQTGIEEQGYITAFACGALSDPIAVELVTFDDTEEVAALRRQLLDLLAARNIGVDATAPLRLSLAIEREPIETGASRPDIVEAGPVERRRNQSDLHEDTRLRTRLNVWSNRRDSVIGGRKSTVPGRTVLGLRLVMSIHDKSDGRCLWRGEAVQALDGRDAWEEAARIVPVLVAAIGETRSRDPLSLD